MVLQILYELQPATTTKLYIYKEIKIIHLNYRSKYLEYL